MWPLSEGLHIQQASTGYQEPCLCNISWIQANWFKQYHAHKKTHDLNLWPMTLIFNRLLEVVKVDVHAKFHQGKCSRSWAIVLTEKQLSDHAENNTAVASAGSNKHDSATHAGSKQLVWLHARTTQFISFTLQNTTTIMFTVEQCSIWKQTCNWISPRLRYVTCRCVTGFSHVQ